MFFNFFYECVCVGGGRAVRLGLNKRLVKNRLPAPVKRESRDVIRTYRHKQTDDIQF